MDNVQRIRNLLLGKVNDSTTSQVGYSKKQLLRHEGDIWEDNGKTWTIKDGLCQSVSKYDEFRNFVAIPFCCPKCNAPLKTDLDKRTYKIENQCLNCSIDHESQLRIKGAWSEHMKDKNKKNSKSYLDDIKSWIESYISSINTNNYVSSDGILEEWEHKYTKEQISEILYKKYDEYKDFIEKSQSDGE